MTTSDDVVEGIAYVAVPSAAVQAAAAPAGGLQAFLSPQEHHSSRRFRREEDRLDYAASHALFRLLGAWRLGLGQGAAAGLVVRRHCAGCGSAEHGKPSICGVALSLSRSHGTVMAAAGSAGEPLGADLEKVPAEIFAGFDDYVLAAGERPGADGPALSDADRIRLWVAKEAVLKAAGLGLALDPSMVRLAPADGTGPGAAPAEGNTPALLRVTGSGNPSVDGLLASGVPAPAGYAAAVAARYGVPGRRLPLSALFQETSRPAPPRA